MHRVVAHVEIETYAIANLVTKMEAGQMDAAPVWSNLKTLPVESFRDRVDLLTGGYPCQPFSNAGNRRGEEDPRHLWPHICNIIRAVRPVSCFFENVEGHISLGLREVIGDLESLGYKVAWGIFSAREIGAPHQRKRVYILADSKSKGYPNSTGGIEQSPSNRWPSRPGQTQHEWEEPRVLADPKRLGGEGGEPAARSGEGVFEMRGFAGSDKANKLRDSKPARKAQPSVGRAADGSASGLDASENRVDRLMLLGNGVVPHTAAKAWITLQKQI